MHAQSTFYEVLDVPPDADREEIRSAYREKVKQTHPDVSDDPDAERRFKRVTRAKEVLTDPDERARYDRLGHRQYVDDSGWGPADADVGESDDADGSDDATPGDGVGEQRDADGSSGHTDDAARETGADARSAGSTDAGSTGTAAGGPSGRGDGATPGDGTDGWGRTGGQRGGASATTAGYATRTDYTEQSFDSVRVPLTPQSIIQIGTMFAFYPVFLFASLLPAFPSVVNVVVGLCTLFVIAYLLSIPEVGMVVFGGWGVLAPAVLLWMPEIGVVSLVGVVALTACWVPFGLAVLTRAALRT
ncbi:MAG: J domain-containing protein [Halorientalis sp.]